MLHEDFDSEIARVAKGLFRIIGHGMLSRMEVAGEGRPIRALGLGRSRSCPGGNGGGSAPC